MPCDCQHSEPGYDAYLTRLRETATVARGEELCLLIDSKLVDGTRGRRNT